MDPNENIKRQRELAANIAGRVNAGPHIGQSEDDHRYQLDHEAAELAELVQALDEWRLKGGFDPSPHVSEAEAQELHGLIGACIEGVRDGDDLRDPEAHVAMLLRAREIAAVIVSDAINADA